MRSRLRSAVILTAIALPVWVCHARAQSVSTPPTTSTEGFRVAGTVVSKVDGHPLANARVALASTKARQRSESATTSDDGKFEFNGVPVGKYSLSGAKRGYIPAGYDQHDQYSTAIVTGVGLDTENLILKLDPQAVISGRVLDEVGEPVRDTSIILYRDNHVEGVHQIQTFSGAQTNDLGEFEIPNVIPGTFFMSASAQPWYAVHPPSDTRTPGDFDRSLDVAYPLTYYGDTTEPDSATPLTVHGGEHLQTEIHLSPVPSLHLIVHVPKSGDNQYPFPQFEHPAFDGSVPVQRFENRMLTPGTWEITGIPAGKYDVRLTGQNGGAQMSGVELDSTTQQLDATAAEPTSSLKVSVSFEEANSAGQHFIVLRGKSARITQGRRLDSKGEAEFENLAAGRYEVALFGEGAQIAVGRMVAEGASVTGHAITFVAGSSASLSITAIRGTAEVQGVVQRSGKPFAGAMVVLVPRNPENNRDLFRRDQSDLDGTFALHDVIPGSYTAVAIENGWDLDWSQPELIAVYAKRGVPIQIGNKPAQNLSLSDPVELQQK
jgi:hypothetical protein